MLQELIKAITDHFRALKLVSRLQLWGYMIIPGFLSLLLAGLIFYIAYGASDNIGEAIARWYPWEWGSSVIDDIASVAGGLLLVIIGFLLYKNLIVVLVGPFMSPLSEKVEKALSGVDVSAKFSLTKMVVDMTRGIRLAVRNLIRELFYTAILFFLGLIPLFSPFTTPLIFVVQSFYAGFGNFDFLLERHFNLKNRVKFMRSHRGMATGNGIVFMLLLFTGIGVLIAPTLGTIAATISGVEQMKKEGILNEEIV